MSSPLTPRIQHAADLLSVPEEALEQALKEAGVDNDDTGFMLMEASTTELEYIELEVLKKIQAPVLKKKAAASILKGKDPFKRGDHPERRVVKADDSGKVIDTVAETIKSLRPIDCWRDEELLIAFDKDRDPQIEDELNKRAKGQRFVILKNNEEDNIGEESIDIDASLRLLKKSRKHKIPTFVPGPDNMIVPVHRITDLNIHDRIVEICPICGELLFKSYCDKCGISFVDVTDDCRAYMKIVVDEGLINKTVMSDRKALMAAASKGIGELRKIYHQADPKYRELKLSDNLPKLRKVQGMPDKIADPFYVSGHRTF